MTISRHLIAAFLILSLAVTVAWAQQGGMAAPDLKELERMLESDLSDLDKPKVDDDGAADRDRENRARSAETLAGETERLSESYLRLETALVDPLSEMTVIYLKLADSRAPDLQEAILTLDGLPLHRHRYQADELRSLKAAAIQPLYVGYLRPGDHRLGIRLRHAGGEAREELALDTSRGRRLVGLQVQRNGNLRAESWQ